MDVALFECELSPEGDAKAYHLAVWDMVLADRGLADLPNRIETNRHGRVVMFPPPTPIHAFNKAKTASLLQSLLGRGVSLAECAVLTTEGVKGLDAAWLTQERWAEQAELTAFTTAPEICVEVISPSNHRPELDEKKALYFEAGAEEVWFCARDGTMEFYLRGAPAEKTTSRLCPDFPEKVDPPGKRPKA